MHTYQAKIDRKWLPDGREPLTWCGGERLYLHNGAATFAGYTTAGFGRMVFDSVAATSADFDRDGLTDLYVVNRGLPDALFINCRDVCADSVSPRHLLIALYFVIDCGMTFTSLP
ncbi:MAG: VCBS repeat-containing protein [Anaerolineaceae bacterium]|nr:VCBS repeat-containing protein [Anaerolineaceae bacterium]